MSVLEYAGPHINRDDGPVRWMSTLGWAIFLGMSWTWCIGMFLPVLLVSQYNIWGWVVFAIPNVVGAAAMGWVLSREAAGAIVRNHRWALEVFGVVTAAFQLFFFKFAIELFYSPALLYCGIGAIIVIAIIVFGGFSRLMIGMSVIVFLISLICWAISWNASQIEWPDFHIIEPGGTASLSIACLFGFAFCPYLDPTFHRARLNLNRREAKVAFGVGFGAFFFSMIIFSLLYCGWIIKLFWIRELDPGLVPVRTHMAVQLALTIGFQLFGVGQLAQISLRTTALRRLFAAAALFLLIWIGQTIWEKVSGDISIRSSLFLYQCFMGMYGLAFPAYVWLCVLPNRGRRPPNSRELSVLAASSLIAMPFFWLAFVDWKMPYVLIGLCIVLLARLFVHSPRNTGILPV